MTLTVCVCVCVCVCRGVCAGSEVYDRQHSAAVPHLPVSPGGGDRKHPGLHEGARAGGEDGHPGAPLRSVCVCVCVCVCVFCMC